MSIQSQVERQPSSSYSLSLYSLNDQRSASVQSSTSICYDPINVEQAQGHFIPSSHMSSHQHYPTSYTSPSRIRTTTNPGPSKQSGGGALAMINTSLSGGEDNRNGVIKRTNKTHVPSACVNCKRAHLACDVSRPCKRCVALGKVDTCIDIKHKKRGRPKLKDKKPHPYNTHATADAKTWSTPQFLPPTTINSPTTTTTSARYFEQPHKNIQNNISFSTYVSSPSYQSQPASYSYMPPVISRPKYIDQPLHMPLSENPPPTITMFLTIDGIKCAKVSEECVGMMAYYPSELIHKSLYDYVLSSDVEKLQKSVNTLLENAHRYYQHNQSVHQFQYQPPHMLDPVTSYDPGFSQISPEHLQYPACGGAVIEPIDTVHLKQRNGQFDTYNFRMYLGGGLGADLTRKETWNKLYVVAFFTRMKIGVNVPNECDRLVQPRANDHFNGFTTSTQPTVATIDPALLVMTHPSNASSNSNLGSKKLGLLSPVLSPRKGLPELGSHPPSLYINPPQPPQNPRNQIDLHDNQGALQNYQAQNISNTFSPIIARPNLTDTIAPSIPHISQTSRLPNRRLSTFNNASYDHDMFIKTNIAESSFVHQLDRSSHNNSDNNISSGSSQRQIHHNQNDEAPQSFPMLSDDERVVKCMISSTIPNESRSHIGTYGADSDSDSDSASMARMSVNSLLCS